MGIERMTAASVKRFRATLGILAVVGLGSLVWFWTGDSLSTAARRLMAGFSDNNTSEKPAIRFTHDSAGEIVVEVYRLDSSDLASLKDKNLSNAEWSQMLAVYTGESVPEDAASMPAMIGAYEIGEYVIHFRPRFPLVAGLSYTARFDDSVFALKVGRSGGKSQITASYDVPKPDYMPATLITNIYPSGDLLPANQLKLYLHFSAPMNTGEAYDHIKLFDDAGHEIEKAFLRLEEELWDKDHRRLTLWFDPGRIKRGLRPNLEMGAPLEEGKRYRLVIDSGWRDANGNPLGKVFEKEFRTTRADRTAPDYREWKLIAPEAGSAEPVAVIFSEAMDHALMESSIEVIDGDGKRVAGRVEILDGETRWLFTPNSERLEGDYKIVVETRLEDRAGNSLNHLFDTDMQKANQSAASSQRIELGFRVKISAGR